MLKLLKKETHTPQTERIYKVPLCIQDTIPIYRGVDGCIITDKKLLLHEGPVHRVSSRHVVWLI